MLNDIRQRIRKAHFSDEKSILEALSHEFEISTEDRMAISADAIELIQTVREDTTPGVMETFLGEYGLSTDEGVALMCLAEALLRVPDEATIDELIRDKITPHDWGSHVGDSGSILINASTWALMLTGRVLDESDPGIVGALQGVVRRLGEPVVRVAVKRAMQELGSQFVLGETIDGALSRGEAMVARGYTYSFDMLGEAARTHDDATRYFNAYVQAIKACALKANSDDIRTNPGISVKLSALHPRYEFTQANTAIPELTERLLELCQLAANASVGLNIDAEEANRLDLSLDIIEAVMSSDSLATWSGLGVVVQAYGRRASPVLDWLYALAGKLGRQIMVRLVKGAYWDSEIKQSQILGHSTFPVFTRKISTDVSYLACAKKLLGMSDHIYPQFATHNAHTIAAICQFTRDLAVDFEFQRLHGMGEAVHDIVLNRFNNRCRIYAPVGAHEDLLAYLVRRLLENGANSSFVNQIVDLDVPPEDIAIDPLDQLNALDRVDNPRLENPGDLYRPERPNSKGFDISRAEDIEEIANLRAPFLEPYMWKYDEGQGQEITITNPAKPAEIVGVINETRVSDCEVLIENALIHQSAWEKTSVESRGELLNRVADHFEANSGELLTLLAREAGKTLNDAIAEIREAVDFIRYYAARAASADSDSSARGVVICISPWNFPLAIFTGQIAAALVTGNAVIAKPAEQTPLVARCAVGLMHHAGIPESILTLTIGGGDTIGAALTGDPQIGGVCFTGSTNVARIIDGTLSANARPDAMLIAETGGINAMIIDSTALLEQAVRDILISAFQSAGQRCSALRMLYIQEDRADELLTMLTGAMDALVLGDPLTLATDIGPIIDASARNDIDEYIKRTDKDSRVIKTLPIPGDGHFISPTVISVDGIDQVEREIFGPVLHMATFDADDINHVVKNINACGFGLTLGLHSRIDARVQDVIDSAQVGNLYVNRNQIGAIVGSQPFGGEGLSGTGPKAGGPYYLERFRIPTGLIEDTNLAAATSNDTPATTADIDHAFASLDNTAWATAINKIGILRSVLRGRGRQAMTKAASLDCGPIDLPGPTGESNRLTLYPLGKVLCVSENPEQLLAQAIQALRTGNAVVAISARASTDLAALKAPGIPIETIDKRFDPATLRECHIDAIAISGDMTILRAVRQTLAKRSGAIVRFISEPLAPARYAVERAVCIDTTAAGGNAELLAAAP